MNKFTIEQMRQLQDRLCEFAMNMGSHFTQHLDIEGIDTENLADALDQLSNPVIRAKAPIFPEPFEYEANVPVTVYLEDMNGIRESGEATNITETKEIALHNGPNLMEISSVSEVKKRLAQDNHFFDRKEMDIRGHVMSTYGLLFTAGRVYLYTKPWLNESIHPAHPKYRSWSDNGKRVRIGENWRIYEIVPDIYNTNELLLFAILDDHRKRDLEKLLPSAIV